MSFARYVTSVVLSLCITLVLIWAMMRMITVNQDAKPLDVKLSAIFLSDTDTTGDIEVKVRPTLPELEQEETQEPIEEQPEKEVKPLEKPLEIEKVVPELDTTHTSEIKVPPVKKVQQKKKKPQKKKKKKKSNPRNAASAKFVNRTIQKGPPSYPVNARRNRVQGHVVVVFSVLPSGAVVNARIASSNPPGVFDKAALSAIKRWKFAPQSRAFHGRVQRITFTLR